METFTKETLKWILDQEFARIRLRANIELSRSTNKELTRTYWAGRAISLTNLSTLLGIKLELEDADFWICNDYPTLSELSEKAEDS